MLVIASDTEHADQLVKVIESEEFSTPVQGACHSSSLGPEGAERDENVERLLAVEDPDEPTRSSSTSTC